MEKINRVIIKREDGSKKRKRAIERRNICHSWSELHTDLLESIMNRLGTIQFLICACVCKSWRAVALSLKQQFMASKPPLIFLATKRARKRCYLYNLFDKSLYKTELPQFSGRRCLGFTCGYLVLRDYIMGLEEPILLVNPFTRHQLEFPGPPQAYSRVILVSLRNKSSVQRYAAVAFTKDGSYIQFCRYGDGEWTTVHNLCKTLDVVAFKGKIYVMTTVADRVGLGILSLKSNRPTVTMLTSATDIGAPPPHCSYHDRNRVDMVACNEDLYLLHPKWMKRLDIDDEKYLVGIKQVTRFGAEKKYFGRLSPPSPPASLKRWGMIGKQRSEGVWYIEEDDQGRPCPYQGLYPTSHYLTDRVINRIVRNKRKDERPKVDSLITPLWYFPHLSCTVDVVINLED